MSHATRGRSCLGITVLLILTLASMLAPGAAGRAAALPALAPAAQVNPDCTTDELLPAGAAAYFEGDENTRRTRTIFLPERDGATLRLSFQIRTVGAELRNVVVSVNGATRSIAPSFSPGGFTTVNVDYVVPARLNYDEIQVQISFSAALYDLQGVSLRYAACPAPTLEGLGDFNIAEGDTAPVAQVITIGDDATEAAGLSVTTVVASGGRGTLTVSGTGAQRTVTYTPPGGDFFTIQNRIFEIFTLTVSDGVSSISQYVSVYISPRDDDPTFDEATFPADISVPAAGPDGATATFAPTATDVDAYLSGNKAVVGCFLREDGDPRNPGDRALSDQTVFPVGTTTVYCRAYDVSSDENPAQPGSNLPTGRYPTRTFTVTVTDDTIPVIDGDTVPGTPTEVGGVTVNVLVASIGDADDTTVNVTWPDVTATDERDGTLIAACDPPSGTAFAPGDTSVTCVATDPVGNESEPVTFVVRVTDAATPTVTVPSSPVVAEATSADGAAVPFTVTARDAIDPAPAVECLVGDSEVVSGATFPLGDTVVTCTATDAGGNRSGPEPFTVTVRDTTAPAIDPGSVPGVDVTEGGQPVRLLTVPATGLLTRVQWAPVTATDAVDGPQTLTCRLPGGETVGTAGVDLPLGDTVVTCTTADRAENVTEVRFTVRLTDDTGPVITLSTELRDGATYARRQLPDSLTCRATDAVAGTVACTVTGYARTLGTHTVTATAIDTAGNRTVRSITYTVAEQAIPHRNRDPAPADRDPVAPADDAAA